MWYRTRAFVVALVAVGICALVAVGIVVFAPFGTVVHGYVTDVVSGDPVQGASIRSGWRRDKTDVDGQFELRLGTGTHDIKADLDGYIAEAVTVTITAEGPSRNPVAIALPRRTLCGQIVDSTTGIGVESAEIDVAGQTAISGEAGDFCLDALVLQSLQASAPGYHSATLDRASVSAHFDTTGRMSSDLIISLEPRGVSGVVTDARTGEPVADVVVATSLAATSTNADGGYTLAYVEPGVPITYTSPKHRSVEIEYEEQATQDVTLEPWHLLVTVTDAQTGVPMEAVSVTAGDRVLATDAEGNASLQIPEGTPLTVSCDGYRTVNMDYGGEDELAVALEFARVSGTLADAESGEPILGGLVQVFAGEPEPFLVRSDEQGRFALEDVSDVVSVTVKAAAYERVTVPVTDPLSVDVSLQAFDLRAVYVPFGVLSVPERVYEILDLVDQTDLNGIVVDVKGDWARIAWDSPYPLAREIEAYADWGMMDLEELLSLCRERDIYTVARIVVFKDDLLGNAHPEWAVKRPDGSLYYDNEDLVWMDPFQQPVLDYNIALAKEIAQMGFDEIQMDYLRFPSDGAGVLSLVYAEEANFETRTAAMAEFCSQMYDAISRTPAFLSADIFGLTVWVDPSRDMGIGQRVDDIAPYVDYLSPMLYPTTFVPGNLSHLGFDPPALYPYYTIYYSVLKTLDRTATKVRPWLQYYSIGGYTYGTFEYLEQRKAAEDADGHGWMFWNARGRYEPDPFVEGAYDQYSNLTVPPPPDEDETS